MIKGIKMRLRRIRKRKEETHALLSIVIKNNEAARSTLDDLKATLNGGDDWFIRAHKTWNGKERRGGGDE